VESETFTVPGVYRVRPIKTGDKVTISGCYARVRNPDRKWWQLWKPRMVTTKELQQFTVVGRS
jgi:hypothetical protein